MTFLFSVLELGFDKFNVLFLMQKNSFNNSLQRSTNTKGITIHQKGTRTFKDAKD